MERHYSKDDVRDEIYHLVEKKYFFYIGDFRDNKNVIAAIRAFEKYSQTNEDIYFFLAGNPKGKNYEQIKEYVNTKGLSTKILFLGYVSNDEKVFLYEYAHAFLFVSLYEGFGVPIIEAMLYHTPVITSNRSSMCEIAVEGSALLVDPTDIEDICGAMKAVSDPLIREQLINQGRTIAARYTWDASYRNFCNAIARLI